MQKPEKVAGPLEFHQLVLKHLRLLFFPKNNTTLFQLVTGTPAYGRSGHLKKSSAFFPGVCLFQGPEALASPLSPSPPSPFSGSCPDCLFSGRKRVELRSAVTQLYLPFLEPGLQCSHFPQISLFWESHLHG